MKLVYVCFLILALLVGCNFKGNPEVVIGTKIFTEGYLLGELAAQTLETQRSVDISRRFGMGATGIMFEAIKAGEIDLYAEYTGTIAEAILKNPDLKTFGNIQVALSEMGLIMSPPLGFNNTYALAITAEVAREHLIKSISDLARLGPKLKAGFSHEFMTRADGYRALTAHYDLKFKTPPDSVDHTLSYEAVANRVVDVIDVYSTDAKIEKLNLVVLEDDLRFFPIYEAVFLARKGFVQRHPDLWSKLSSLKGTIDERNMRLLNAGVDLEGKSFAAVIKTYRGDKSTLLPSGDSVEARVWRRTKEHFFLVISALIVAILIGVPLGILATRHRGIGQSILMLSGLIQTIPSLALLCFLIPVFGIGTVPALVALCLYGLLPVVLNTFTGIRAIEPGLMEMSHALGLTPLDRLLRLELPLASRSILAGVRTSAIIGIGTATLAALIGAGGYGVPIVSGLATNNMSSILTGAIPAAVMALLAHGVFEILELSIIPKGLRK